MVFGFVYLEYKLSPIIATMAEQKAKSISTLVINSTIYDEIERASLDYDDLISFEKDASGNIKAIKTNTIRVSQFKSYITMVMTEKLAGIHETKIAIPIGTVLSGDLFSGRGPKIKIILNPVGSVSTDITNVFSAAGINQTKHQIMLEVHSQIAVIIPFKSVSTEVSTTVCIAETVIVGNVPTTYADVNFGDKTSKIAGK